MIDRTPGSNTIAHASLALALTLAGDDAAAAAATDDLLLAAEATDNPHTASFAMLAHGFARRDTDPDPAFDVERAALKIAQDSGNRQIESHLAVSLARLAATQGDPDDALDYFTLAIHNFYDSGNFTLVHSPLAILAAFFDRRGDYEPAAIISGFVDEILAHTAFPEIIEAIDHLREVLGKERYESFARLGANMTNAQIANYAFEQIDRARAEPK